MAIARGIRAGRAFVELFADDSRLVRGLRRAERRIKAFGRRIRAFGLRLAGLGTAMLTPMVGAAKAFSSMGDQVAKMAKRTGLSVETLSELKFVASQTGTSIEALETGFRRMQRSIYDAGRGLSTQTDALRDLGLTYKDLKGLAPEQQFKILAEAISRIEDPTRKAALAQALFGRAGTQLLPMMAKGAAGIEALQAEARRLGLTMSAEDAKAAEDFTDALDALWKTVKMGIFRIGAALAPTLKDLAERFTDIAVKVGDWIRRNKGLIVSALKFAAVVVGVGIALAALGTIIAGLGSAIGVLVGVVTTVGTVLKAVGAVLAFLLSPIGAVIAAVAALGGYLVYATGTAGKALAWLGEKFGVLKEDALTAYQGIADALAAGDIGLAAKILWLTLKLEWTRGIGWLKERWADFKAWFLKTWSDIAEGALAAWDIIRHNLAVGFIEVKSQLRKWWAELKGLFDWSIPQWQIEAEKRAAEAGRRRAREAETRRHEERSAGIVNAAARRRAEIEKDRRRRIAQAEADLARARKEWHEAIQAARRKREAKETAGGPEGLRPPDELRAAIAGIGDALERATTRGTFYAFAVSGLDVANDAMRRTAAATERTARNTDLIVRRQPAFV